MNEEYIEKSKEEILQENDISIIEDFSSMKNNILNWYNFKKDSEILEINTEFGGITKLLTKKAKKVISICKDEIILDYLEKKYKKVDNLQLCIDEKIAEGKNFDYIIFYKLKDIELVKKYLKENGVALLMIDNKFSITSFAGAKPKNGKIFETIMENNQNTATKIQIEKALKQNGFEKYTFYYPLPNYRMPNVIFSDKYMPHENTTKLMYNICYRNGSAVVFDELKALKQLTKDGQFDRFTNSYLVEINNEEQNQPKFISFNNIRKPKYRLMTKIYDEYVEKTGCFKEAKEHINNIERNSKNLHKLGFNIIDQKEKENIKCRYVESDTLDKILANKIKNEKIDEAYQLIEKWYRYIKERLVDNEINALNEQIKVESELINELTIIKNGYIDIVFENIFIENEQFILFDQEWYIEGIPVEFILYRAINNLYVYNQEINKIIPYEKMMEKFKLSEYIEIFRSIENYIQKDIIDEKMQNVKEQSLNKLVDINLVALMNNKINDYEKNDKEKDFYIKHLEEQIKLLQEELQKVNEINTNQSVYIKHLEQNEKIEKIEKTEKNKKFWKGSK